MLPLFVGIVPVADVAVPVGDDAVPLELLLDGDQHPFTSTLMPFASVFGSISIFDTN